MENTSISSAKVHKQPENTLLSSSKNSTNQSGISFMDALSNHLLGIKQPTVKEAIAMQKTELRAIAKSILEEFRIQSQSKRMELIEKLLKKSENEEDSYSKCLEIFKKLMRGEKVSPEEMKYLMQFAPLLFLVYQLMQEEDAQITPEEPEEDSAEQSAESNTDKCSSSIAQAVLTYTPDTAAAS